MEFSNRVSVKSPKGEYVYSLHGQAALRLLEEGKAVYCGREGKKVRDIVLVPTVFSLPEGGGAALSLFRQNSKVKKLPIVPHYEAVPATCQRLQWNGGADRLWFPLQVPAGRLGTGEAKEPNHDDAI